MPDADPDAAFNHYAIARGLENATTEAHPPPSKNTDARGNSRVVRFIGWVVASG